MIKENTKFERLLASRSYSNESEGREMFGCIADDSGKVVCYFPTKSSFEKYSQVICENLEDQE